MCTLVGEGSQLADIVRMIQMLNRGLEGDDATRFAAIAANSYCPQALSAPSAASQRRDAVSNVMRFLQIRPLTAGERNL